MPHSIAAQYCRIQLLDLTMARPIVGCSLIRAQGGFYALSRDLVQLFEPEAQRMWDKDEAAIRHLQVRFLWMQVFGRAPWDLHPCRGAPQLAQCCLLSRQLGEDAFVFSAIHLALAKAGLCYRLRHLTWTRFHNLPKSVSAKGGGMGWIFPSNSSSVVHWIKHGEFHIVHNESNAARTAFRPFRFIWRPRSLRIEHAAQRQQTRWSIYRKNCWIFGCHAPYRGGELRRFVEQSADLSPSGLEQLRTAPPFNEREFLGSRSFPISNESQVYLKHDSVEDEPWMFPQLRSIVAID